MADPAPGGHAGRARLNLVNPLLDLSYDYDPVGNVLAITDTLTSEVHGYLYDQRDRLTEWRLKTAGRGSSSRLHVQRDRQHHQLRRRDLQLSRPSPAAATHRNRHIGWRQLQL